MIFFIFYFVSQTIWPWWWRWYFLLLVFFLNVIYYICQYLSRIYISFITCNEVFHLTQMFLEKAIRNWKVFTSQLRVRIFLPFMDFFNGLIYFFKRHFIMILFSIYIIVICCYVIKPFLETLKVKYVKYLILIIVFRCLIFKLNVFHGSCIWLLAFQVAQISLSIFYISHLVAMIFCG